MQIKTGLIVAAWISIGVGNAGFVNADLRADTHDLHESRLISERTFLFSLRWGIMAGPFGVLSQFLLFKHAYQDGWTLTAEPFPCEKNPEIWCDGAR